MHEGTVRRWADAGRLPFFRTPGGHRRFLASDVSLFVHQGHYPGNRSVEHIETQVLSVVRNRSLNMPVSIVASLLRFGAEQPSQRYGSQAGGPARPLHLSKYKQRSILNEAKEMMRDYGREAYLLGLICTTLSKHTFFSPFVKRGCGCERPRRRCS